MPTLKIQKADGTFEFLQLAGEEFADIGNQVLDVKSQLKQTVSGVMNVKKGFKAKGDYNHSTQVGTDDTLALQQAIDNAQEGQTIYLPNGRYLITSPLEFRRYTHIRADKAYIYYRGTDTAVKAHGSSEENIFPRMEGIHIRKEGSDKIGVGLSVQFSRGGGQFTDCSIWGFEYGLVHSDPTEWAWFNSFEKCNIQHNRIGVLCENNTNGVTFNDCIIRHNEDGGMILRRTHNTRVINGGFEHNGKKSGGFAIYSDGSRSLLIQGNYFEKNGFDDDNSPTILVGSSTGNRSETTQIIANYFMCETNYSGIKATAQARGLYITGNHFFDALPPTFDIDLSEMTSLVWVYVMGNRGSANDGKINMPSISIHATTWIQHGTVFNKRELKLTAPNPRHILEDTNTGKTTMFDSTNDSFRIFNSSNQQMAQFRGSTRQVDLAIFSGNTASRPTAYATGHMYFDTTLGKPIWRHGDVWKDANGTTV